MAPTRSLRALVIGGGMGGLGTALALRREGIAAEVFERMPRLQEVGSGLTLWANGTRTLERLSLGDSARAAGVPIERIENRRWGGAFVRNMPIADIARKVGLDNVGINRQDLQRVLAEAWKPGILNLAATFVDYVQDDSGVTARFADGREARGDVLIGADGINSAVRKKLLGESELRYAGYTCWRSAVRFQHEQIRPNTLVQAYGNGTLFGIIPAAAGTLTWYITSNAPQGGSDPPGKVKSAALDRLRGVYEPLRAVVEATEDAAINRIDICDRDPVDRWGEGRVTLIGDAVHPPTPFLGQGACMALEDALVVARLLAATDDIPSALRSFAAQRKARTAWIQGFARRMGAWYHAPSMLARYGRDISMVVMPDVMLNKQMEKVINYEA